MKILIISIVITLLQCFTSCAYCQEKDSLSTISKNDSSELFVPFKSWFKLMKLDSYFTLDTIISKYYNKSLYQKFDKFTNRIAGNLTIQNDTISSEEILNKWKEELFFANDTAKLKWVNYKNKPNYILVITPKIRKSQLKTVEGRYLKKNGLTLWTRIFKKLSFTSNTSSKHFFIYLRVQCSPLIYEIKGVADRHEKCRTMIASEEVTDIFGSFANPIVNESFFEGKKIVSDFKNFMDSVYEKKPAIFQFLADENNYVELIIRGLKSEVIRGGRDWEKIQINFQADFTNDKSKIRLFVDGAVSSGFRYPSDSHFTKSMEPDFSNSLNNYTKALALEFKNYLIKKYQNE